MMSNFVKSASRVQHVGLAKSAQEPYLGRMVRAASQTAEAQDAAQSVGLDCWIGKGSAVFGNALNRYWRPNAGGKPGWYWVVAENVGGEFVPRHLVVEINGALYDAEGAHYESDLEETWKARGLNNPVVIVLESKLSELSAELGFAGSDACVKTLEKVFLDLLGPVSVEFSSMGTPRIRGPYQ